MRPIPLVTKTLNVEFFPEGGDMIEGVPGRVYFMVRTPVGEARPIPPGGGIGSPPAKPADLKGYITDGTNTVVPEVFTLTDAENPGVKRGQGRFELTPKPGVKYFLKISTPIGITEPTKDGFPLPVAKADGVALTALDAVTERGAAIRVRVQSSTGPKTLHVGAYARGILIAHQKIEAEANKPIDVSLKGDEAAGGVTRITVFEEPAADNMGRVNLIPRAERLVYRASGEHLILNVNPDKSRYTPGGKVRLELSAFNEKEKPTPAVLLVGVVNQSVITMADNKTDRLMPTHFLLSGDVKHPAELEHADFLLTDHKLAGKALDLLLGTQGWRRFAEQTGGSANPADKADVDHMLVAHGQRTTAPLELFKLEEQRVNAEFQPKLEQAQLQVATREREVNATPAPLATQLFEANTAIATAQLHKSEAAEALDRYESRFEKLRSALVPGLMIVLGVVVLFIIFMAIMAGTAEKPAGRGRPYLAGAGAVVVCGLLVVGFMNLGTTQNKTFTFVGSAIKPDGERARIQGAAGDRVKIMEQHAELMPAAPPRWMNGPGGVGGGAPPMGGAGMPMPAPRPAAPEPKREPNAEGMLQGVRGEKADLSKFNRKPANPAQEARGVRDGRANDMALLADALKKKQPAMGKNPRPEGLVMGVAGEPRPRDDGEIMGGRRATVLPFVVREYAHERDPSLGVVRSDFTETVYWHPVLVLPESGKTKIEFQLADDIARYQVLVAGHTTDGRIGAITKTIEARKPFSVDPKMPLEISHTDTMDVPLRVTNDSDDQRKVALGITVAGFKPEGNVPDGIDLGPNGKGRKMLRLKANQLEGDGTLMVSGTSGIEKDSILRTIKVVPDGFPGVGSFSDMIEGKARSTITLPKDVVPGSLRVRLEVYPTSLADLVKGLDGLLREPYGCFEQTSTSNYPNAMILDYMNQTNQANPAAAARAKDLLAKGYSRLTSFECKDTPLSSVHGFEWFGAADMQHEALSAYGLMQFKDMSRVSQVDPQLIKRTQEFLLSRRDGKGGFKQNPRALHSWGASKQVVNAYIVWALVESDLDDNEHLDLKPEIAALKAEALDETSANGKDSYFVALTANIMLYRGERETAHKLLDRLMEKNFKNGAVTGAVTSVTSSGGRDLEIETTAIALLGWLRANDPKYATTIKEATKWISQQRGGYGGFGSTQSTILALKALTLHAKKSAHPAESGELQVKVGGNIVASRKFTKEDVEVIGLDIDKPEAAFKFGEKNEIEIVTDAKQAYPFALSYTYTTLTPVSAEKCTVAISTKLARAEANEGDTVPLAVTLENKQKQGQGMAVAIVGIPAGMKVPTDMKQLTDLREKGQISFFEIRGRELILDWRDLAPAQKIALSVDLVCDVPGTYRGPASRGYLYYNADNKHWVEPLSIKIAAMAGEK